MGSAMSTIIVVRPAAPMASSTAMALRARLAVDNMTYGELTHFVDLARMSAVDPASPVIQVNADSLGEDIDVLEYLEVDIEPGAFGPRGVVLSSDEVQDLVSMIDEISAHDGDARGVRGDLGKWRDRLLGL